MGAQANIVDSVHIFIAIAAHKGLAAYALGSSIVDSQVSGPYLSLMVKSLWHIMAGLSPVCQQTKVINHCAGLEAEASLQARSQGSLLCRQACGSTGR